jgi:glutathione S-transferase
MKLFYAQTSPYVRKVLIVAHELGLADRIERIPAKAHPVDIDRNVMAMNPLAKVPALVLDDGTVLFDSPVIAEYLNDLGKGSFFPAPGPARWEALTQQALADGMLDAALLIRYEITVRPEPKQWDGWQKGQFEKITSGLKAVEAVAPTLGLTIGAVTIACALGYLDLRYKDFNWRGGHPATAKWHAEFAKRPSYQATMPE